MQLWRSAENPWGQEVLIGISWNLMWAAVVGAILFLLGHAIWYRMRSTQAEAEAAPPAVAPDVPEKIERHSLASRIFHWTMSVAMLALLVTAFGPVMGWQFPWVEIHWMAGVLFIATVVYHVIHAVGWQDFWAMFKIDVEEGKAHLKHVMSSDAPEPKAGKYPFDHRMYHHIIVLVSLVAIVTGVLMMVRIDTPFWTRDPYLLSDATWGVMYVLHGLSGVSLILLVAAHIYFAIRPEKRWITWSMIRGWIDREHYLQHFDPEKWTVGDGSDTTVRGGPASGALADSAVSAPRED